MFAPFQAFEPAALLRNRRLPANGMLTTRPSAAQAELPTQTPIFYDFFGFARKRRPQEIMA